LEGYADPKMVKFGEQYQLKFLSLAVRYWVLLCMKLSVLSELHQSLESQALRSILF
jgi:hypothetical protein